MGMYDKFGDRCVQIKIGTCRGIHYKIGDITTMPDGLYIGCNGVIAIKHHVFVAEFGINEVFTKWGDSFSVDITKFNPVYTVVSEVEKKYIAKESENA